MAIGARIQRFFKAENTVRVVELLLAVLIVSLSFGWESKGIRYVDLNKGDYDEAGNIVFFLMIAMVSLLFLLCVITYSVVRSPRLFPPCLDLVISSSLSLLLFIAAVILAHSLSSLGKSLAVREAGLGFAAFQATLVFSLALAVLFAVSAAFAFCYYRRKSDYMMSDSRNMADLPDDIPT
ncbi:unnamed protein product [Candidula unifasciata]|uniref:MARVEL domain-containing protein n=1 Tax=Candidula unifasciata TaxID=100452 RepID=A0A8S3YUW2_9EUPU|nr:unnamed protein product [Candidula unifasciata]